jgi:hypothetical protein
MDDWAPEVSERLLTGEGPVRVRLSDVAAGRDTPAYTWLADGEAPPPATIPLVLGRKDGWRLHVDLACSPDVLTIVGPDDGCRRLAAAFARQLLNAGLGVSIVDDVLGDQTMSGVRLLDRFPQLPAPRDPLPEPYVLFCTRPQGPTAATARQLAAVTHGRAVPVILASVPGGRWSIQLGDTPDY